MIAKDFRLGLVGPLPPPSGGMANQTRQLARLLGQEGVSVEIIQVNAAYRPQWIGALRGVRALARLLPYLLRLWSAAQRVQVFHVMANSGWAWHLYAAPAVWIARLRGVPVVVNYRGGYAEQFFERSFALVAPTLRAADRLVVPSRFLQQVFARFGLQAEVVPNVIDLARFVPRSAPGAQAGESPHRQAGESPHVIVTRNLEPIYDIGTALRALAIVRQRWPAARMTVAGSGPERDRLVALAAELGLADSVAFSGRLDNDRIDSLYREADVFVNPSLVDNMPISVLEALASGVPVVSTEVGGVPFIVEQGKTGLLVPAGDPQAMAQALLRVLDDAALAGRLAAAGRESVQQYGWHNVRARWLEVYAGAAARPAAGAAAGAK